MPHIIGSTTFSTAAAVIAASTALPPSMSTRRPAAEASGWLVAIMPFRASTGERPSFVSLAGRSPGAAAASTAGAAVTRRDMTSSTGKRIGRSSVKES